MAAAEMACAMLREPSRDSPSTHESFDLHVFRLVRALLTAGAAYSADRAFRLEVFYNSFAMSVKVVL